MALKISLLLDGELPREEVAGTLADVERDATMRDRYTLYGLAGDVLRGNSTPDDGFSQRIFERMRGDGVSIDPDFDPLK